MRDDDIYSNISFPLNYDVNSSFFTDKIVTQNSERLSSITVNLYFAECINRDIGISLRIRGVSSVVVVDDVSTVVGTGNVDRIGYCSSGISSISETEYAVLFFRCVG